MTKSKCIGRRQKNRSCPQQLTGHDLCCREQFLIPQPSARYSEVLQLVPQEYVGPASRLAPLVHAVCAEMSAAFQQSGMSYPPWRQANSMLSKWLPTKLRDVWIGGGEVRRIPTYVQPLECLFRRSFFASTLLSAILDFIIKPHITIHGSTCTRTAPSRGFRERELHLCSIDVLTTMSQLKGSSATPRMRGACRMPMPRTRVRL